MYTSLHIYERPLVATPVASTGLLTTLATLVMTVGFVVPLDVTPVATLTENI